MTEGIDTALTQVEFGDLVGIGQLAVSDLMARQVIGDGGAWPPPPLSRFFGDIPKTRVLRGARKL